MGCQNAAVSVKTNISRTKSKESVLLSQCANELTPAHSAVLILLRRPLAPLHTAAWFLALYWPNRIQQELPKLVWFNVRVVNAVFCKKFQQLIWKWKQQQEQHSNSPEAMTWRKHSEITALKILVIFFCRFWGKRPESQSEDFFLKSLRGEISHSWTDCFWKISVVCRHQISQRFFFGVIHTLIKWWVFQENGIQRKCTTFTQPEILKASSEIFRAWMSFCQHPDQSLCSLLPMLKVTPQVRVQEGNPDSGQGTLTQTVLRLLLREAGLTVKEYRSRQLGPHFPACTDGSLGCPVRWTKHQTAKATPHKAPLIFIGLELNDHHSDVKGTQTEHTLYELWTLQSSVLARKLQWEIENPVPCRESDPKGGTREDVTLVLQR